MFSTHLKVSPSPARAGVPSTLTVRVEGPQRELVPTLAPSHGESMHLFVISDDLESFAHVHPKPQGGSFVQTHTFEAGGGYTVFVDYARPDRDAPADRHSVQVGGPSRPSTPLTPSSATQQSGGLTMTLHGGSALRAGAGATLQLAVTDAATGRAVEDLEPYLGAMAHFVVLSGDGKDFLHVHPLDTKPGQGIAAHTAFPRAGLYKMWVQVQRRGTVVTVPFVLRVAAADDAAHPGGTAGGHHGHH